jgi:hypothetical protein
MLFKENQCLLFKNIVQFNAAELQGGGGSGLGLWSKLHLSTDIQMVTDFMVSYFFVQYRNQS